MVLALNAANVIDFASVCCTSARPSAAAALRLGISPCVGRGPMTTSVFMAARNIILRGFPVSTEICIRRAVHARTHSLHGRSAHWRIQDFSEGVTLGTQASEH